MNKAAGRRFFTPLSALIAVLGVLAGCAGNAPAPNTAPAQTTTPAAPQTAALPAPRPAPAPKPEPEIDAPAPAAVIGWSTDALNDAFGAASLVRHDLGAEIWQYRTEQCVLLLFLYPQSGQSTGPLTVRHLDISGSKDAPSCVRSVVRSHLRLGTG
ncbi:hypothetical protein L2D14_01865 [Thalassospiraceae bacterium LMO-JJ14]|nr:hypothetical protein L2D14_01865 [Thalassospiraceae bacterium LMO-JJ14]